MPNVLRPHIEKYIWPLKGGGPDPTCRGQPGRRLDNEKPLELSIAGYAPSGGSVRLALSVTIERLVHSDGSGKIGRLREESR